jgi:hypothetical protein
VTSKNCSTIFYYAETHINFADPISNKNAVAGNLYNEKVHNLCSSPNIIVVTDVMRDKWADM